MKVKVHPSAVAGSLQAPASKSCTQRALAAALIKTGRSVIKGAGRSNDELVARDIIQSVGAIIEENEQELIVTVPHDVFKQPVSGSVHVGESGLSMRMFAPIAALFHSEITLDGEGSILTRPMDFLDRHLPDLGVAVKSNKGKIPITLKGPLRPKNIAVDGSLSSQFLTGLLYAFSSAATKPTTIEVQNLTSRPYIDLTLDVLDRFGFIIENDHYELFRIPPNGNQGETEVVYTVEGDWSNVAFLLVAGGIAGEVMLSGIDTESNQGDSMVLAALDEAGIKVHETDEGLYVKKPDTLKAFEFDATHCPDLFPPLVALAANCEGISIIEGASRLFHKESNRAVALQEEFGKMNVHIELKGDLMIIHGSDQIVGAEVSSHNDHRIAMAATVAALNASSPVHISGAEAVKKSYPGFYDDMRRLGVVIE